MTNYKGIRNDYIDIGGFVHLMKSTDKIILIQRSEPTVTTHTTLHDRSTGANYQVPSGKKAKVIYAIKAIVAHASDKLYYSDDADASTNPVTLIIPAATVGFSNAIIISVSIPAGKYINVYSQTSGATEFEVYILEEDA